MKKVKIFSNWKLRTKLFVIMSLCIAGSLLLCVYNMFHISHAYNRELYESISNFLSLSASEIQYKLDNVQQMVSSLGRDSQIQSYLSHSKDAGRRFFSEHEQLYYLLQNYYKTNRVNCVANISLFTDQFTLHTNPSSPGQVPEEVYDVLCTQARQAQGQTVCVTQFSREHGLFFVKEIRRIDNLRLDSLAVMVVRVGIEDLVHSSVSLNQYNNFIFLLTQPDSGELMYSSRPETLGASLSLSPGHRWEIQTLGGVKYFVAAQNGEAYAWNYLFLVPYNEIFSSISQALVACGLYFLVGTALIFLLCQFLVHNITCRFARLISQMDQFAKYTPDMELPIDEFSGDGIDAADEVGMLSRHFSHMAREIDGLIQTDYTNRILLRDAQLKALESQINPHFLYNTLSAVSWRAKMAGVREISDMVEALSNLLRVTLNDDSGLIPLEQELSLVQSYIVIQRLRFDETLDYRLELDEECLREALIPKLTLQPLIENAIRYGIEASTETCLVLLFIRREGDRILLLVQNQGSLYEEDLLEKLHRKVVVPHGHGIGLLNIEKRLELAFGKEATLELLNQDGMATARIKIPYRTCGAAGCGALPEEGPTC